MAESRPQGQAANPELSSIHRTRVDRIQPQHPKMKIIKTPGQLVLAIYLILVGLIGIFGIRLGELSILLPLLALVAGILILLGK